MEWIKYTGINKKFLTTQSGMAKCPRCGHVFYYEHGRLVTLIAPRIGKSTNFPSACPQCGCVNCKRLTIIDYLLHKDR